MRGLSRFSLLIGLIALFSAPGFAANLAEFSAQNKGKSIAVVSLTAASKGSSLKGWKNVYSSSWVSKELNKMLEFTENSLASSEWKVVRAASFVPKKEFQALTAEEIPGTAAAEFGDVVMLPFAKDAKQLNKASLSKETASQLASITGAEFVMVIHSEWSVQTGNYMPVSKAVAKTAMIVYDASGNEAYSARADMKSDNPVGGQDKIEVHAGNISEWVSTYVAGLKKLYGI